MLYSNRIAWCLIGCLIGAMPAARAEVVPVVSARCSVTALTQNQLVAIFLGKESRFPNGEPVMPLDQAEGNEARDEFYTRYAGQSPAQLKAYWSKLIFTGRSQPPREIASVHKLRKLLAASPYAIGYLRRSEVELDATLRIIEMEGSQ